MTFNALLLIILFLILSKVKCGRNITKSKIISNTKTTTSKSNDYDINLKETEISDSLDYQENKAEERATEPPEFDPNSELVDENGIKVKSEGVDTNSNKTKGKLRDLTMGQINGTLEKVEKTLTKINSPLISNLFKTKNSNKKESKTKNITSCLESPDSGFWCDGGVGKTQIRFYYEKESANCQCLLYYGCNGNTNNFFNFKDCKNKCNKFGFTDEDIPFDANKCQFIP